MFHADFAPVTQARPARAGEVLILLASGLGPTRGALVSGQPFPNEPFAVVNSPVEVLVNGIATDAVNQIGAPGTADTYRVDFRVPDAVAAGAAAGATPRGLDRGKRRPGPDPVIAMKRRIEVTRERWRRIRVESRGPAVCASCRGAPELAPIAAAAERCGVSAARLTGAIGSGLLSVWETGGGEPAVCLGCVKRLKEDLV